MEDEREKNVVFFRLFIAVCLVLLIFFYILLPRHMPLIAMPFLFIAFVVVIVGPIYLIYWFVTQKRRALMLKRYKSEVIAKIVQFIDPALTYSREGHIEQKEFEESKLFVRNLFSSEINSYGGDDLVRGKIGQTAVSFSDLHVDNISKGTDNKTESHYIFYGLFFVGDFNKHFEGETFVLPHLVINHTSCDKPEKTEDPEFEKLFKVFGTDPVEARYILSPSLMKRMINLKTHTEKKIYFSFVRSKVFIAIETGEMFEPPFFSSMLDYSVTERYFHYLNVLTGIVEELDLNTRVWTKK